MEHNCPNCGARVEDGVPFCPKCNAPQIRVSGSKDENDAATPPLPPGTPGEIQPPAERVDLQPRSEWQQQTPMVSAPASEGIEWKTARRIAIIAGVVGVFGSFLGSVFVLLLWVLATGGISITLYQRRVPRTHISAANGFRIGALTGLISGIISGLFSIIPALSGQGRSLIRERIGKQAAAAVASNPDPTASQIIRGFTDYISRDSGLAAFIALSVVFMTLLFIVLGGLGGAIGASLFGKHRES